MDNINIRLREFLEILAPGILFLFGVSLGLVGFFELQGNTSYRQFLIIFVNAQFVSTVLLLIGGYLIGSAIRLFANDVAEICSGFYLRYLKRSKAAFAYERFPYPSVVEWIRANVNKEIADWYELQNPRFSEEQNKDYYNYCKLYLQTHSPKRAEMCSSIEFFVRFLAGSFIATGFTGMVCFTYVVIFAQKENTFLFSVYLVLGLINLLIVWAILDRFRHQHTREVMHTWLAYYDARQESTSIVRDKDETPCVP